MPSPSTPGIHPSPSGEVDEIFRAVELKKMRATYPFQLPVAFAAHVESLFFKYRKRDVHRKLSSIARARAPRRLSPAGYVRALASRAFADRKCVSPKLGAGRLSG